MLSGLTRLTTPTRPVGLTFNLTKSPRSKTISIATRATSLLSFVPCDAPCRNKNTSDCWPDGSDPESASQEVEDSPGPTIKLNMLTGNFVLGRIDVANWDYHHLSRFEIAGDKRIYQQ
jgi:hypothetical protein